MKRMVGMMERMTVLAVLVCALLPRAAWAVEHFFYNQYGSVAVSELGITTEGSELVYCLGIVAPKGHSLGKVVFATGPLIEGSIFEGGTFSSAGSSFIVTGKGNYGEHKGTIFAGQFRGKIHWTLVSKSGANLVFELRGPIEGQLYTGRVVDLSAIETIATTENELAKGVGHIVTGQVIGYP